MVEVDGVYRDTLEMRGSVTREVPPNYSRIRPSLYTSGTFWRVTLTRPWNQESPASTSSAGLPSHSPGAPSEPLPGATNVLFPPGDHIRPLRIVPALEEPPSFPPMPVPSPASLKLRKPRPSPGVVGQVSVRVSGGNTPDLRVNLSAHVPELVTTRD